MCVFFLFHWFSSENFIYVLRSLRKGQQTSKELKRNNNDIVFLMSLLNGFFIKKETLAQVFSCEFCEISKNIFFKELLQVTASDF